MRTLTFIFLSCFCISGISFKNSVLDSSNKTLDLPPLLINLDRLTNSQGWRLASITSNKPCDMNEDGVKHLNMASEMPACALDDILFISKSPNKAFYKRGVLCGNEPKNNTYNWTLTGNKLVLSQGDYEDEMQIVSVDDKKMEVSFQIEALGEAYVFTAIYTH